MAEIQENIRKSLGAPVVAQWAKQMADTQEALLKSLGMSVAAQWANQIAGMQENIRKSLGTQVVAQWAKQLADTQEALLKSLGTQVVAQWVKQMAETQEALLKSLGTQGLAQWTKQMTENQDALMKTLVGQTWAQEVALPITARTKSYQQEPRTVDAAPVAPDPEAARPESKMLARHANRKWLDTAEAHRLLRRIEKERQQRVLVLVADIRKSSQAMMEALSPLEYASSVSSFVESIPRCRTGSERLVRQVHGRWVLGLLANRVSHAFESPA